MWKPMDQLWDRILNGDSDACRQAHDMLYRYGVDQGFEGNLVADCIQDLFTHLLERKEMLSNIENVYSYLKRSLRNKIYSEKRTPTEKKRSKMNVEVVEASAAPGSDMKAVLQKEARLNAISEAMKGLPSRQREVLDMRYFKQLDVGTVASRLGISRQTVMNTTFNALNRLRSESFAILSDTDAPDYGLPDSLDFPLDDLDG